MSRHLFLQGLTYNCYHMKTHPFTDWAELVLGDNPEALAILDERKEYITKAFSEVLDGYKTDPATVLKKVAKTGNFSGLVCEAGIKFQSMCRHHFLPFAGTVGIVYEPGEHIFGIGKISRLVQVYSKRLQFQEKLSQEIAEEFMRSGAKGVFVEIRAKHMCMGHRGPSDPNAVAVVSVALGSLQGYEAEHKAHEMVAYSGQCLSG